MQAAQGLSTLDLKTLRWELVRVLAVCDGMRLAGLLRFSLGPRSGCYAAALETCTVKPKSKPKSRQRGRVPIIGPTRRQAPSTFTVA